LKINIVDNANINHTDLGKKGLYLSKFGRTKYVNNVLTKIKELC